MGAGLGPAYLTVLWSVPACFSATDFLQLQASDRWTDRRLLLPHRVPGMIANPPILINEAALRKAGKIP